MFCVVELKSMFLWSFGMLGSSSITFSLVVLVTGTVAAVHKLNMCTVFKANGNTAWSMAPGHRTVQEGLSMVSQMTMLRTYNNSPSMSWFYRQFESKLNPHERKFGSTLSLCVSVSLCVYVCPSLSVSVSLRLCLSLCPCLSVCLSRSLSGCLSLSVSVSLSLSLSGSLFLSLWVSVPLSLSIMSLAPSPTPPLVPARVLLVYLILHLACLPNTPSTLLFHCRAFFLSI